MHLFYLYVAFTLHTNICLNNLTIHRQSDNIQTMMGTETDEIIEEHFESLLQRYQKD